MNTEWLNVTIDNKTKRIPKGNLTYKSAPVKIPYRNPEMASFSESYFKDKLPVMGWHGEGYAAVGSAGRLSRILLDTEDKQTLHIGELWDLGEGYTLIVKEIGAEDRVVLISLAKNGNEVYSGIVERDLRPALVVATPVGFVNAAKSKEIVRTFDTPSISCMGTRGGEHLWLLRL